MSQVHRMSCRDASCIVWQNGLSWIDVQIKILDALSL